MNPQDKYPQRIKKADKAFVEKLDYSRIEFPITVKKFNKIENQNKIKINVFGYEEKQPYPVYLSKGKYEDCINLFLMTENENEHYVLIKDSTSSFTIKQDIKRGNISVCIVCNVSVLKKY